MLNINTPYVYTCTTRSSTTPYITKYPKVNYTAAVFLHMQTSTLLYICIPHNYQWMERLGDCSTIHLTAVLQSRTTVLILRHSQALTSGYGEVTTTYTERNQSIVVVQWDILLLNEMNCMMWHRFYNMPRSSKVVRTHLLDLRHSFSWRLQVLDVRAAAAEEVPPMLPPLPVVVAGECEPMPVGPPLLAVASPTHDYSHHTVHIWYMTSYTCTSGNIRSLSFKWRHGLGL